MFKTTVRFIPNSASEEKILKTKEEPAITCETGFIRFVFFESNPFETFLVNSEYILSVAVEHINDAD